MVVHGGLFSKDGVKLDDLVGACVHACAPCRVTQCHVILCPAWHFCRPYVPLLEYVLCCCGRRLLAPGAHLPTDLLQRKIDRFMEPPDEGFMCEMLWSDPQRPKVLHSFRVAITLF